MTRDELIESIGNDIREALPENIEVDADDIDSVENVVEQTLKNACDAIDEADDEDESEGDKPADA